MSFIIFYSLSFLYLILLKFLHLVTHSSLLAFPLSSISILSPLFTFLCLLVHHTPFRMAKIFWKMVTTQNSGQNVEKLITHTCCWECKLIRQLWTYLAVSKKKKNMQVSLESLIIPLGIYPRELKTYLYKNLHKDAHSSLTCNDWKLETTYMSFSRHIVK